MFFQYGELSHRGPSAPEVALGLVLVQHAARLPVEGLVQVRKPLHQVLVHGGLGHPKELGRVADRGAVFRDVAGFLQDAQVNPVYHQMRTPSPRFF